MINKPPACKGLDIRISIIAPIKGRGFINQGSTLTGAGFLHPPYPQLLLLPLALSPLKPSGTLRAFLGCGFLSKINQQEKGTLSVIWLPGYQVSDKASGR